MYLKHESLIHFTTKQDSNCKYYDYSTKTNNDQEKTKLCKPHPLSIVPESVPGSCQVTIIMPSKWVVQDHFNTGGKDVADYTSADWTALLREGAKCQYFLDTV